MSITRVGSTKKFADGWDNIFTGKSGKKKSAGKKAAAKSKGKKAAKNSAPAPAGNLATKRAKKHAGGKGKGPGDEEAKKSAAKRKSKTRTKRPKPALQQKELF